MSKFLLPYHDVLYKYCLLSFSAVWLTSGVITVGAVYAGYLVYLSRMEKFRLKQLFLDDYIEKNREELGHLAGRYTELGHLAGRYTELGHLAGSYTE